MRADRDPGVSSSFTGTARCVTMGPLSSPASVVLVKTLIERKRSRRFTDDNLLIGDYKLKNVNGELRLWAEARQTPTPKGQRSLKPILLCYSPGTAT